jgi:hypothetical protein
MHTARTIFMFTKIISTDHTLIFLARRASRSHASGIPAAPVWATFNIPQQTHSIHSTPTNQPCRYRRLQTLPVCGTFMYLRTLSPFRCLQLPFVLRSPERNISLSHLNTIHSIQ